MVPTGDIVEQHEGDGNTRGHGWRRSGDLWLCVGEHPPSHRRILHFCWEEGSGDGLQDQEEKEDLHNASADL